MGPDRQGWYSVMTSTEIANGHSKRTQGEEGVSSEGLAGRSWFSCCVEKGREEFVIAFRLCDPTATDATKCMFGWNHR